MLTLVTASGDLGLPLTFSALFTGTSGTSKRAEQGRVFSPVREPLSARQGTIIEPIGALVGARNSLFPGQTGRAPSALLGTERTVSAFSTSRGDSQEGRPGLDFDPRSGALERWRTGAPSSSRSVPQGDVRNDPFAGQTLRGTIGDLWAPQAPCLPFSPGRGDSQGGQPGSISTLAREHPSSGAQGHRHQADRCPRRR
jgi:hypothetical protein